jgi:hypothetical protein
MGKTVGIVGFSGSPRLAYRVPKNGDYSLLGKRPVSPAGTIALWRGIQLMLGSNFHTTDGRNWPTQIHSNYARESALRDRLHIGENIIIDVQSVANSVAGEILGPKELKVSEVLETGQQVVRPELGDLPLFWNPPAETFTLAWTIPPEIVGLFNAWPSFTGKPGHTAVYAHCTFDGTPAEGQDSSMAFFTAKIWIYGNWTPGGLPFGPIAIISAHLKDGQVWFEGTDEPTYPVLTPWGDPNGSTDERTLALYKKNPTPTVIPLAEPMAVVNETMTLLGCRNVVTQAATGKQSKIAERARKKAGRSTGLHVIKVQGGRSRTEASGRVASGERVRAWNGRRGGYAHYGVNGAGKLFGKYTCSVYRPMIPPDEDATVMWEVTR